METLLTVVGFLGLGALLIALYVFTVAARRYVSGEAGREEREAIASDLSPYRQWQQRSGTDRRCGDDTAFPAVIAGEVVEHDRRAAPDRRRAPRPYIRRSGGDRRADVRSETFPLAVRGKTIQRDRRAHRERRKTDS